MTSALATTPLLSQSLTVLALSLGALCHGRTHRKELRS